MVIHLFWRRLATGFEKYVLIHLFVMQFDACMCIYLRCTNDRISQHIENQYDFFTVSVQITKEADTSVDIPLAKLIFIKCMPRSTLLQSRAEWFLTVTTYFYLVSLCLLQCILLTITTLTFRIIIFANIFAFYGLGCHRNYTA